MMSTELYAEYLGEPDLIFGQQKEEKDPRIGLRYLGPYHYPQERGPSPGRVKVGIVGTGPNITTTKLLLARLRTPITSPEVNKWLYPDFPGFALETMIKSEFETSQNWEKLLKESELDDVLSVDDPNRRIGAAVELYLDKIHAINSEDNLPDVIVCTLSREVERYCGTSVGTATRKPKVTSEEKLKAELRREGQSFLDKWGLELEEDDKFERPAIGRDLRNALKGRAMVVRIPLQILRESSALGFLNYGKPSVKITQEPASFAWNLATALYYKANGKPWRLAKLRQDTCYIGISFFHDQLNPNRDVQTSMAQVFTHNGEGLVLR